MSLEVPLTSDSFSFSLWLTLLKSTVIVYKIVPFGSLGFFFSLCLNLGYLVWVEMPEQ